jgi:hypothetical protein
VNSTGAKTIIYHNAALTSSLYYWSAGDVCEFVYDGTYWVLMNVGNTDTWRGITDSYSGTSTTTSLSQKGANALYNALVNGYANSAGSASYSNGIQRIDDRSDNTAPYGDVTGQVTWHLKTNSSVGLPSTQTYSGVMILSPWSDSSGGAEHWLAFNSNGSIYHRYGLSSWNSWKTLCYTDHTHSYLPLSGGTLTGNIILGTSGCGILGSGSSIPSKFLDSAGITPEAHSIWLATTGTGSSGAGTEAAGILLDGNTIKLWSPMDTAPQFIDSDNGASYTIYHSGNLTIPTSLPANGGNADTVDNKHASDFATSGHTHDGRYLRWNGNTADVSSMSWGTLTAANGYNILSHASSSDGGDMGYVYKGGQIFHQIDGYFYQNEGKYRCLDTSDSSSFATSGHNHNSTYAYVGGSNASGTWPINVSGSATSATSSTYVNGYTYTITVDGEAGKYYPVVLSTTSSKKFRNFVTITKDLGTKTSSSYAGNHSNGTSSCLYRYDIRNCIWDGNGGYCRTLHAWYGYAQLCCHTEMLYSSNGSFCIWLRGGGTEYTIVTSFSSGVSIYYSDTNVGSSTYPAWVGPKTSGNNGVYNTNTSIYASNGFFDGHCYAGAFYQSSDERLKTFKDDIKLDLNALKKIPKKYFTFNDNDRIEIGTSAQEIQILYPELVTEDSNGYLSVAYDKLSVIALAAVDKLTDKIETLEDENKLLKERLDKIEKMLNI